MKIIFRPKSGKEAYAIALVFGFTALGFIVLGSAMMWTSTNSNLIERNNQYFRSLAAAEAATEQVVAEMSRDFQVSGAAVVAGNMNKYRGKNPKQTGNASWNKYKFTNGKKEEDATHVETVAALAFTNLQSQYKGLSGLASTYRIVSNAEEVGGVPDVVGAIGQEIQTATIPIFQFAIFSSMDLEINPGPDMNITGRVHANGNIYEQPQADLVFESDVTSGGEIIHNKKPGDPTVRNTNSATITYEEDHDSGVNSLTLPIGTNNTPDNVRKILDAPPVGESATSLMGEQRYFNKSDLVIEVTDTGVLVHGTGKNLSFSDVSSFVKTNVSFYNAREGKTVKAVEINVGNLVTFSTAKGTLQTAIGNDRVLNSVYVADKRTQTSSTEPGIKVVNGATLPKDGLTISTPNPLYVQGNYNAPADALGTANTSKTKPASLVADAVTILSAGWKDTNGGSGLSSRIASATTVNAALLAGIVPTTNNMYSGGVENFPRFLEDWTNKKLTYNGSMVLMFESKVAKAPWSNPTAYYAAPLRNWAFDVNFLDPAKLPPGTPSVRTVIRGAWGVLPPDTTTGPIKKGKAKGKKT